MDEVADLARRDIAQADVTHAVSYIGHISIRAFTIFLTNQLQLRLIHAAHESSRKVYSKRAAIAYVCLGQRLVIPWHNSAIVDDLKGLPGDRDCSPVRL